MASALAPSDAEVATGDLFTSRLSRRGAPLVRTSGRALRAHAPGRLAGNIGDFGNRLGLSHTSRWALDEQRASAAGTAARAAVRPPLNYWPWAEPGDEADLTSAQPEPAPVAAPKATAKPASAKPESRMDALRKMLGLAEPEPEPTPAPTPVQRTDAPTRSAGRGSRTVHRGLPRTLTRRASTASGAPGDIAQRMRPQAVDPRAVGTRAAAAPPPTRAQPRPAPTAQRAAHWAESPSAAPSSAGSGATMSAAVVPTNRPGTGSSSPRPTHHDGGRANVAQPPNSVQRTPGAGSSPSSSPGPQAGVSTAFDGSSRPPTSPRAQDVSSGDAIQRAASAGRTALAERPVTPVTPTPEVRRPDTSAAQALTSLAPLAPARAPTDASTGSNTTARPVNAATGRRAIFDASSTSATADTAVQRTQDAPAVRPPSAPIGDTDIQSEALATQSVTPAARLEPTNVRPMPQAAPAPTPVELPTHHATSDQPTTTAYRPDRSAGPVPRTSDVISQQSSPVNGTVDLDASTPAGSLSARTIDAPAVRPPTTPGALSAIGDADTPHAGVVRPRAAPAAPDAARVAADADARTTTSYRPETAPARTAPTEAQPSRPGPATAASTQPAPRAEFSTATDSMVRRTVADEAPTTTAYRPAVPAPAPVPTVDVADSEAPIATSTPTNRLTIGDGGTDESSSRGDADVDHVGSPSVRPPSNPTGRTAAAADFAPAAADFAPATATPATATPATTTPATATPATATPATATPTTTSPPTATPTAAAASIPVQPPADLLRQFDGALDPGRAVRNQAPSDDDGTNERSHTRTSPGDDGTFARETQPVRPPTVPTVVAGADAASAHPVAQSAAVLDTFVQPRPGDRSRLRRPPDRTAESERDVATNAAARLTVDAAAGAAREIAREMVAENVRNDGRRLADDVRTADVRASDPRDDVHERTRNIGSNIGLNVALDDDATTATAGTTDGMRRSLSTRHSYSLIARPPAAVAGDTDLSLRPDAGVAVPTRPGENQASPSDAVVRRAVEAALVERFATPRPRRTPADVAAPTHRRLVTPRATSRTDPSRARGSLDQITLGASIARPAGVDRSLHGLTSTTPRPPVSGAGSVTSRDWARTDVDDAPGAPQAATDTIVQRTAAEIAAPALDAAARFRQTLQRATVTTTALPTQWQPLANAIVGDRRVRISTSAASQAALKAAGKIAATTGDVVHLARSLRPGIDAPLLAHELTHVAAPSPHARFFDDHRDSPEERRAELMADVIRRSPVLPRSSAGSTSPGEARRARRPAPPSAASTISRSLAPSSSSTSSSSPVVQRATDTVSAADLVARLSGTAATQVQRSSIAPPRVSSSPQQVQRRSSSDDVVAHSALPSSTQPSAASAGSWTKLMGDDDAVGLNQFIDMIVDQLEDRIGRELERRGGRYRGEF